LKNVWLDGREAVVEQFEYRELLFQLTRRDLLIRYKQALMGFGWAVFMPLINTAVFSIIFHARGAAAVDVPYPLFAYLVAHLELHSVGAPVCGECSDGNINLVTKVYCPREVFVLSTVFVTLVDTLVGSVVLIALMPTTTSAQVGRLCTCPVWC